MGVAEQMGVGSFPDMRSQQRIAAVLDKALAEPHAPRHLLDRIVAKGIADGLEWYEIVTAVDEAERRTGLPLHPVRLQAAP